MNVYDWVLFGLFFLGMVAFVIWFGWGWAWPEKRVKQ